MGYDENLLNVLQPALRSIDLVVPTPLAFPRAVSVSYVRVRWESVAQ